MTDARQLSDVRVDDVLGQGKWGAGPTAAALTIQGPWVVGALINNVWSFAGDGKRKAVNQMLLQPIISYNLPGGWYVNSIPMITADWKADAGERWTVPIGGGVGRILRIGPLPLGVDVGAYYNVVRPHDAAAVGPRQQRIEPVVTAAGYDLDGLSLSRAGRRHLVRLGHTDPAHLTGSGQRIYV